MKGVTYPTSQFSGQTAIGRLLGIHPGRWVMLHLGKFWDVSPKF
jgi:hypothetical protein